jgi:hypothetical protein
LLEGGSQAADPLLPQLNIPVQLDLFPHSNPADSLSARRKWGILCQTSDEIAKDAAGRTGLKASSAGEQPDDAFRPIRAVERVIR